VRFNTQLCSFST